jgi:cellulose 1,4-beta-cellobiosidase
MCDPDPYPERAAPPVTGAMPAAPPAGEWFPVHFQTLLRNAWPPLGGAVSPARR